MGFGGDSKMPVGLSDGFHSPSANSAVQTEMNTIRIVSANMVLIFVVVSRLSDRNEELCVCLS